MRRSATLVPIFLLAAACSSTSGTGGTGSTTDPSSGDRIISTPSSPAPSISASASGSGETEIESEDSALGPILTDSEGRTLYLFLQDRNATSTCAGSCAQTWPAVTTTGTPKAGDGVSGKLGTSERADGTTQVTIAGHPLYTYASDAAPGDTNGQGVGQVWFVVSPKGSPVKH
jgi:predicted lipoprotein with Yx(FWY)xxD motif